MIKSLALKVLAIAIVVAVPALASAAGLGRLTVLSALGQPLNAEIDIVSLQPGEETDLVARLASSEAFRQAGIEFSAAVIGIRFAIERRGTRHVLKMTTTQPVSEPFVELLVELQWAAGRLTREYTFLLDPIEYKGPAPIAAAPARPAPGAVAAAPAPSAAPAAPSAPAASSAPAAPTAAAPGAPASGSQDPQPSAQAPAAPIESKPLETPAAQAQPATPPPATMREVVKGDTLGKIAREHMTPGVTFNQMLIALYRANQDAFIRDNINLVREGRILNIPDPETVAQVDVQDANRLVRAQMADFNEYRAKLAGIAAPAESTPGQREVAGQIAPKPDEPKPAAAGDQLKLSRAEPQKPGAAASRAAKGDDAAARERALKEAQSRVTDLEKNVADMQKLLEIQNQQMAQLQQKPGAKPAAPAPAAKAPEKPAAAPAKPAAEAPKPAPEPQKPAVVAQAPAPKPEAAKPAAEAPKPAAPAPAPAAKAPEAAKPAAPAPGAKAADAAKPKPKPAAAPQPEPSVVDEFLDNPLALGGLGGVAVLLVGYGAWAWRRKKKAARSQFGDSVLGGASIVSQAAPAAGGAAAAVSQQASISQGAVAPETDEVDPIAEADVYMAYGRDAQAEEILKEALAKDANRPALHAKMLEIYAQRRDAKSFEQTALKLKQITNGAGAEWEKASALGRSLDPQNGLYGSGGATTPVADVGGGAAAAPAPVLDFDIGSGTGKQEAQPDIPLDTASRPADAPAMDFDLGGASTPAAAEQTDFAPGGTLIIDRPADTTAPVAAAAPADTGLDFKLDLDAPAAEAKPAAPAAPLDLSEISLDLGTTSEPPAAPAGADPKWQEVATKLDLAKAYEEMGDKDGAKELLGEVVRDGDAAQKQQAEQMLAKLT